jgi:uncharacterized OB-fold protein
MSHKTDYFGRPQVKRLPPVKCKTCGRVVAAERVKDGACYGCAKSTVPNRGGYVKTARATQFSRAGSLL